MASMASIKVSRFAICALTVVLVVPMGCARLNLKRNSDYRTVATSSVAKPKVARRKHEKAIVHLCDKCYPLAEQLLHEALIADASFGPAHNTLGKVYYDQRKFYLAAWEFEHAIKSMPDRAEPVNNLGLVYEAVGKLDDAVAQYELAASMNPEKADYLGNAIRCRIRRGEHASTLRPELQMLIELDSRDDWVRWAKLKLTTDRTGNDWRQSGFLDNQLGLESFSSIESIDQPEILNSQSEENWISLGDEANESLAPEIDPSRFSGGDLEIKSGQPEEINDEFLPFEK